MIQLIRTKIRKKKKRIVRSVSLRKSPQKLGICTRVYTVSPKKPNSAIRKVARVKLSNKKFITTFIPGGKHNLLKFSTVLIRGGRVRDIPSVVYRCIPGKHTLRFINRKTSRSKYGVKKS